MNYAKILSNFYIVHLTVVLFFRGELEIQQMAVAGLPPSLFPSCCCCVCVGITEVL